MSITFTIYGEPKGQPRPKAFSRGGHARVYDPGTAEGWKSLIAHAVTPHIPAVPIEGPIRVDWTAYFPRPKRLMRRSDPEGAVMHTAKPDRDNVEKALLDALTQIGMWRDDAQVCDGRSRKFYAEKNGRPRMEVTISEATQWPADLRDRQTPVGGE